MGGFIIVLIVVVCVLLSLVILVQNPKGGGLAAGFQSAGNIGGVQRTTDFLEKATWYLSIGLFVLCLVSARWYETGISTPTTDDIENIEVNSPEVEAVEEGDGE